MAEEWTIAHPNLAFLLLLLFKAESWFPAALQQCPEWIKKKRSEHRTFHLLLLAGERGNRSPV